MSKSPAFRIVEGAETAQNPDVIVALPVIREVAELLLDCAATGGVGLVTGPSGSGKTIALKRLAARYPTMGLPGQVIYSCCQVAVGATRGCKDLLSEMGVGGIIANGHGAPMQLVIKIAQREFVRRNIRCALLDEIDRWDDEAIAGLFALHDRLREGGHSFSLVLASNHANPSWLTDAESLRSRTLRNVGAERVSVEEMVGLLAMWSAEFASFAAKLEAGHSDAVQIAHILHDATTGDLRQLNFFARVYERHFHGREVSEKMVKAALTKLDA